MKKSEWVELGNGWKFEAIRKRGLLKKDIVLSTLFAFTREGGCNYVSTNPGSQGCGLATALMKFCFTDPDVGSLNPATSTYVFTGL